MAEILHNDWAEYLNEEFQKEYYIKLRKFLAEEYRTKTIYPDMYTVCIASSRRKPLMSS